MTEAQLEVRVQRTPNPNSMLFLVNRALTEKKTGETYSSAEVATASPLAAEIFKVAGVSSVFFLPNSITVTRDPRVPWEGILTELESAIRVGLDS